MPTPVKDTDTLDQKRLLKVLSTTGAAIFPRGCPPIVPASPARSATR